MAGYRDWSSGSGRGSDGYLVDEDGWTLRSADGSRAAQVYTVAGGKALILTASC